MRLEQELEREEQNQAQRLLQRARGQPYVAQRARWLSWRVLKIDRNGYLVIFRSGLPSDEALALARDLNEATLEGIEMGFEQGAEWGTRG